jgi:hypothetical protein
MSLARIISSFAFINSPAETSSLPQWAARIFSVIVTVPPKIHIDIKRNRGDFSGKIYKK